MVAAPPVLSWTLDVDPPQKKDVATCDVSITPPYSPELYSDIDDGEEVLKQYGQKADDAAIPYHLWDGMYYFAHRQDPVL